MNKSSTAVLLVGALLHGAHAAASTPNKDSFLVTGLADIEPAFATFDGTMYAGLLPFNEDGGEFMFWLFEPTTAVSDSLTLWLNGGPGCTSFHGGVLFEMEGRLGKFLANCWAFIAKLTSLSGGACIFCLNQDEED